MHHIERTAVSRYAISYAADEAAFDGEEPSKSLESRRCGDCFAIDVWKADEEECAAFLLEKADAIALANFLLEVTGQTAAPERYRGLDRVVEEIAAGAKPPSIAA